MTEPQPRGTAVRFFETLDSTSEEARRCAVAGEPGPLWIVAAEQTSGRGRRGRSWASPRGNLMTTLLIRPQTSVEEAARLSFAGALAAADAVAEFAPSAKVVLKWPNDVLAEGAKIAGVLLESQSAGARLAWLSVGIGVNLAWAPADTPYPATSLAAIGGRVPGPADAWRVLSAHWERWYRCWEKDGFAPLRAAWLSRAGGLGQHVVARLEDGAVEGVFAGLSDAGALELRLASGLTRTIGAGEVFFGQPPGPR